MRLCALVLSLFAATTALAQPEAPPVADSDLRRSLQRIYSEAGGVLQHPENSLDRAMAISRWATSVTEHVRYGDAELRGEAALLLMATQGLAAAARREDATDVRAWAQVVGDRARRLLLALSTESW